MKSKLKLQTKMLIKRTKIALLVAGLIASSSAFSAVTEIANMGLFTYDWTLGSYNLGSNATTTAIRAVALGANTIVSGQSSIAIGYGSVANVANTVSFGAGVVNTYGAPLTRTLTNITAGVNATDAVNVGQLNTVNTNITNLTNSAITQGALLQTEIATNTANIASNNAAITTTNGLVATNTANIATNTSAITTTTTTANNALGIANNSVQYDNSAHTSATVNGTLNVTGNIVSASNVVSVGLNAVQIISGSIANGGVDRITTDGSAPNAPNLHLGGTAVDNNGSIVTGKSVNVVIDGGLTVSANQAVSMSGNKITQVGAGTTTTDAVNYGQLAITNGLVATNTANIAINASDIIKLNDLIGGTQTQINGLQNQVTQNNRIALQGIAGVAAMGGLPALEAGKKYNVGMSVGNYKSESAIAIGAQARIMDNMVVKASVGASGSNYATSVGVGISW